MSHLFSTAFHFFPARRCWLYALFLIACSYPLLLLAQSDETVPVSAFNPVEPQFIRVIEAPDDNTLTALELSIVSYTHPTSGLTVDLISALHIADKAYYDALNQRFTDYDVLLFELVTNVDTNQAESAEQIEEKPSTDTATSDADEPPSFSGISRMQIWMKDTLDLDFQLEAIDYSADNLVHADFTPEEFEQSLSDNNESLFTEMARLWRASMLQSLLHPEMNSELGLFQALFSHDRDRQLKQQFARQFAQQFSNSNTFDQLMSADNGSTLITARNQKAMDVLQQQIDKGKQRIGIFYGAAHMPDFDRRLKKQHQLKPTTIDWIEAWDLR